jgi:hypothetical protein
MEAHYWWSKRKEALLGFLMDEMDCQLPPCLRVLRHVYRRGLDWFQQRWSFRLESKMCFDAFCACMHFYWMRQPALLGIPMDKMDCDLPSGLQVLRHVYRRGLNWFQQCQSFRLGYSFVLVQFVTWMHGWWTKRTALLQFLLNKMDRDLPSCLQVLQHVYRRGLVWFQQHWSFCLGLAMCSGPFGT